MEYRFVRLEDDEFIKWLEGMNKTKGFKPISISVTHGAGIKVACLYELKSKRGVKE